MSKNKRAPLVFNNEKMVPSIRIPSGKNESESLNANEQTTKPANVQTTKQTKGRQQTSRFGRQFIAAHVELEAAKQFKMLALQKDMTTQDLLIEAINDVFSKYKMSRIA